VKKHTRLLAAAGLVLTLGACSPQQWINNVFGAEAPAATRVAQCESHMNPGAVSATNDHGLFQINGVHRPAFSRVTGQPWSEIYNPEWNTRFAKHLYDTQGWRPWTCRP
jgi:hypothetical protein